MAIHDLRRRRFGKLQAPRLQRTSYRKGRSGRPLLLLVVVCVAGFCLWPVYDALQRSGPRDHAPALQAAWVSPQKPQRRASRTESVVYAPARAVAMPPRSMPSCTTSRRNCVVDGDTLWLDGEKIRILNIDTPEIDGKCTYERNLAQRAKRRLRELVDYKPIELGRRGEDRYGRTLAIVNAAGRDVGAVLISEELARRWDGGRRPWC